MPRLDDTRYTVLFATAVSVVCALLVATAAVGLWLWQAQRLEVGVFAMALPLAWQITSAAGWVLVPLMEQISFTAGTTAYTEGSTLTQGAVSSTVKRVVLESGTWGGGTAAGRLIIDARMIGQALTNLLKNAFEATPAGGGRCRPKVLNTWPMKLSGVQFASPMRPPGRQTRAISAAALP